MEHLIFWCAVLFLGLAFGLFNVARVHHQASISHHNAAKTARDQAARDLSTAHTIRGEALEKYMAAITTWKRAVDEREKLFEVERPLRAVARVADSQTPTEPSLVAAASAPLCDECDECECSDGCSNA